jgi:hypothetical protein
MRYLRRCTVHASGSTRPGRSQSALTSVKCPTVNDLSSGAWMTSLTEEASEYDPSGFQPSPAVQQVACLVVSADTV